MGLFEIRVTLGWKDKSSKPKLKFAVSLIPANNEEHLLVCNLFRQDVSLLSPETYKKYLRMKEKIPEQHLCQVMFALAVLTQEENAFFCIFSCIPKPCGVVFNEAGHQPRNA